MKQTIAPFAVPSTDVVNHGGWRLGTADGEISLPVDVEHWDYQTVLRLSAPVSVDRARALDEAGLSPDTDLAVLVTVRSDHTGCQRRVALVAVPPQARYDLAIEFELDGHDLGGRLDLDTLLVATAPVPARALAARRPASILWRARHRTHLEGQSSRFPTDSAEFALSRPSQADAGWVLQVDLTDPDASFMSSVRLTLNSGQPIVQDLLRGASDLRTAFLRRAINWDVTRQLALAALSSADVHDGPPDPDATSVAGVLRNILAAVWPHDEPTVLRRRLQDDPGSLEVHLQSQTRLFAAAR